MRTDFNTEGVDSDSLAWPDHRLITYYVVIIYGQTIAARHIKDPQNVSYFQWKGDPQLTKVLFLNPKVCWGSLKSTSPLKMYMYRNLKALPPHNYLIIKQVMISKLEFF